MIRQSSDEKEQAALTSFSARALEYLVGSELAIRGLVEEILDTAMVRAEAGIQAVFEDAVGCLQCAPERFDVVKSSIVGRFSKWICGNNPKQRKIAADVINGYINALEDDRIGRSTSPNISESLISEVKQNCRAYLLKTVSSDASSAEVAWKWFGTVDENLVRTYGLSFYYCNPLPGGISGIDGITAAILCASKDYHKHFKEIEKAIASKAISIFGQVGFTERPFSHADFKIKINNYPPIGVWEEWFREFAKRPAELAGVCFAFFLLFEQNSSFATEVNEPRPRRRRAAGTESPHLFAMVATKAVSLKKLPHYDAIEPIIARRENLFS